MDSDHFFSFFVWFFEVLDRDGDRQTRGADKSAVLNSLIGHPVLSTGENETTRAPICIDLQQDNSLSSKILILQVDNKSQQLSASALRHSLQERLSNGYLRFVQFMLRA